jgi:putative membrane-bound dehydrogenase-like protein
MAWKKGALISAAPEIIYAEDTDGDGKADLRRTLLHGFATENYQARVNGLSYGLDNWVYGANGLIGGTIHGTTGGREINIGGRDFRFKPDTPAFEPAAGVTQQGRVHDDWGNQFGGNSGTLIQHYPLPDHYTSRNPRVAAPAPAVVLARGPDASRLYPTSRTLERFNEPETANHVTSACSPLIYRDDLLGAPYSSNAFICEPVHNLVHRLVVEPRGATFSGHRATDEKTSEFLSSTDSWFRPVQVLTGPDGGLWIVDMYRFVIEHPRWISPDRLTALDVRGGADKGRIYRVVPAAGPARPVPRLDTLSPPDLAAALDTRNGTVRDNAQRLLVARADLVAVPVLDRLVKNAKHPEARAQALGALDGLAALKPPVLQSALADPHPGVRRQAVRLSEPWLGKDSIIGPMVLALANDPDTTVRYQVALSLGEWSAPAAGQALGRLAIKDGADSWIRAAVLSSSVPHAARVLEQVVASPGSHGPSPALIEPLIATLAASRDRQAVAQALAVIGRNNGDQAQSAKASRWRIGAAAELLDSAHDATLLDEPAVKSLIATARSVAGDRSNPSADRLMALRLLGRVPAERAADRELMAAQLDPAEPLEVQLAAVRALVRTDDRPSAQTVISCWPNLGPAVRTAALDALLARPGATEVLLSALANGQPAPASIDAAHRQQLLSSSSEVLRHRAESVFNSHAIGPRQAVLDAFASAAATATQGNPDRGKKVFATVRHLP